MFSLVDAVCHTASALSGSQDIHVHRGRWVACRELHRGVELPELHDLQATHSSDLEMLAVMPSSLYGYARTLQMSSSESVKLRAHLVYFFRVLGVSPVLGRDFLPEDEQVGAAPVVVLSERVWRVCDADRKVIGLDSAERAAVIP